MSGAISNLASGLGSQIGSALGLPTIATWQTRMKPASFRGVPFFVMSHEMGGGRRTAIHELPLRERPVTEDMGASIGRYSIDAYVVGDNYDQARDSLIKAVWNTAGSGLLVHPYLGQLSVQATEGCSLREHRDQGRIAQFKLNFVEAGDKYFARATVDTASTALSDALKVMQALKAAYAIGAVIADNPSIVLGALEAGLSGLVGGMLGLPVGTLAAVSNAINAIVNAPTDMTATPTAIVGAFEAATDAIIANPPTSGDLTGGMASLASWDGAYAPIATPTPAAQQQAANATLLTDLANGCAVASVAQIYAQTAFSSAQDASTARTQLVGLIDTAATAAANAGDNNSFDALNQLAASSATDLIQRAQSLPTLAGYSFPSSLPWLALAQRLYPDASIPDVPTQADTLYTLNNTLHPLFMPAAGNWLQS